MRTEAWAETYAAFGNVVVVVHDVSGQAEVADLHNLSLGEEDVPGSQVSVYTLDGENNGISIYIISMHQRIATQ